MRILFTFVGGNGHFSPLAPVARAAQAAGHTVAVAGSGRMRSAVEAAGFTTFPTSEAPETPPQRRPLLHADPVREERDLRENFARSGARHQASAILDLAREWKPDVLVRDEVDFGTAIAAERLAVPCATVLVFAAGGFLREHVVTEPLNEIRSHHGLPPDPALRMLERHLVLSPFPPSFRDPDFPLPARAFSFRNDAAAGPAVTATDVPTVYFTLGTEFNTESGDLFSRVLAGLREVRANVVATVGKHIDPEEFGPQPTHVRLERYIPQGELLPRCDLVLSHGGSGSVTGALAHGLPSILFPMGADQPHNARRSAALGTARTLDPMTATPEQVRSATSETLSDERWRRAAERVQTEFNRLPGPEKTVSLLEKLP